MTYFETNCKGHTSKLGYCNYMYNYTLNDNTVSTADDMRYCAATCPPGKFQQFTQAGVLQCVLCDGPADFVEGYSGTECLSSCLTGNFILAQSLFGTIQICADYITCSGKLKYDFTTPTATTTYQFECVASCITAMDVNVYPGISDF
jgi:hypothetical protein